MGRLLSILPRIESSQTSLNLIDNGDRSMKFFQTPAPAMIALIIPAVRFGTLAFAANYTVQINDWYISKERHDLTMRKLFVMCIRVMSF